MRMTPGTLMFQTPSSFSNVFKEPYFIIPRFEFSTKSMIYCISGVI
jgi:hypothetical protein